VPPLKIFISHSHDEEWLAEMIAAELQKIDVDPFYYKRNETGTPITSDVRAKLNDCDEFLILLTPTSIWSHWVLYELSVAHYLGKAIRPFSMYLSEQEIPPMVRDLVRRPMGEIRHYYDEVRGRVAKAFADGMALGIAPNAPRPMQVGADDPSQLKDQVHKIVLGDVTAAAETPPSPEPRSPKPAKRGARKPSRRKPR